ncbi:MAG: hypothetical protein R2705_02750 [Ilumatobacteraceae bacterium]
MVALLLASVVVRSSPGGSRDGTTPFEALVIVVIVVANAILGILQEARAAQAVSALAELTELESVVVRSGRERRVASHTVVPGDVLMLAEGGAVSADARVVGAASLHAAEASLTGESMPVTKHPMPVEVDTLLADRTSMVFSGTAITSGRGRAIVTATGTATEIGHIAQLVAQVDDSDTPLQRGRSRRPGARARRDRHRRGGDRCGGPHLAAEVRR